MKVPDIADIRAARERIAPYIHRTPVLASSELNALSGAELFFKCENFQKAGAFKARGAHNAIFAMSDQEAAHGVVTHSSGNHGAAVALAARRRGIPAHVVVPENAMKSKVASIERYGAKVIFSPPTAAGRQATAAAVAASTGARMVHPFDDPWVVAGQGTAALELVEDFPDLNIVMAPIGGGGLLSGTAVAVKATNPAIRVYGAEPASSDDAARSLREGRIVRQPDPQTIADGLRSVAIGEIAFSIFRRELEDVVTVTEEGIVEAMRLVWQVLKVLVEPSAAVSMAAVLARPAIFKGKRVGLILSGGNVDLDHLPWVEDRPPPGRGNG